MSNETKHETKHEPSEPVLCTKGIFEFDQNTYIYRWWLIFGDDQDFLAALYKPKKDEPLIRLTYRFKYHASSEHFDPNDQVNAYWADFDGSPDEALAAAERAILAIAEAWGSEVEALEVNGGVNLAVQKLTAHKSAKTRDVPPQEPELFQGSFQREGPEPEPEKPVCDFCGSEKIRWAYPAEDFAIGAIAAISPDTGETLEVEPLSSEGPWAACAECAALIEQDNYKALTARALDQNAVLSPVAQMALTSVHAGFKKHRTGPRQEIA